MASDSLEKRAMRWKMAAEAIRKRTWIVRLITLGWFLLIVLGSLQSRRPGSLMSLHRQIHWLAFAGAALLLLLAARNCLQALQRVSFTFLLGLSLEYLQHLIYHKATEWLDVADDAVAILAAFGFYWLAVRRTVVNAGRFLQ